MNPLSCQAPYLRGVRLLERGDPTEALAAFERAAEDRPRLRRAPGAHG